MPGQECENCHKLNQDNDTYCYHCGAVLPAGLTALKTHHLEDSETPPPQIRWGTAYFGERSILRIRIRHVDQILEAQFDKECVLGRLTDTSTPEVDLTPYGAAELGVSRMHAKLTRQSDTIMIQDLGSTNGTFLNGDRLIPFQPRVLRNEDELNLGQLTMRISFMRRPPAE